MIVILHGWSDSSASMRRLSAAIAALALPGGVRAIRLADYRLLGDAQAGLNPLENAVRRRADELVAPLDEAARKTLREAFVGALVRIDDQGRYGRCAARWDGFDPAVHALLDSFVAARLLVLRSDEAGQRSVVLTN